MAILIAVFHGGFYFEMYSMRNFILGFGSKFAKSLMLLHEYFHNRKQSFIYVFYEWSYKFCFYIVVLIFLDDFI